MTEPPKPVSARAILPTADLAVHVDSRVEGSLADWPSNIQDGVLKALAVHEAKHGRSYKIISSWCDQDFHGKWYLRVVAQAEEIIIQ